MVDVEQAPGRAIQGEIMVEPVASKETTDGDGAGVCDNVNRRHLLKEQLNAVEHLQEIHPPCDVLTKESIEA